MSYLLTEIALEMLGYKFYDIDGSFGPTNFQQNTAGQQSQTKEIYTESLQNVMVLDTENENNTTTSNERKCDENTKSDDSSDIAERNYGQIRTFSAGLKKLLDLEYDRLRSQVEQTMQCEAVRIVDANLNGLQEKNGSDDGLKIFIRKEKEKLKTEAHTLKSFRNLVEKSTFKMNPDVFRQYERVFVGSNK
ncbi:uncharacterized protein LOC126766679 [Bactrocera neohumeralis]|uniref:uncharacterized protein LOC120769773 n=1 Tax=Bactrocera tryoni TaxID=59916 RepID=UPI001A96AE2F|nr:uncharacterized protein LOC120769773 [Bactrocera tryoni]XP_050340142.1 uncharacterized protein LOC126766385 [Bactrocera neohumeralis]XP_050340372.1 uncharacterized protein LOC126766679 [Bactrocera neohumeralis]